MLEKHLGKLKELGITQEEIKHVCGVYWISDSCIGFTEGSDVNCCREGDHIKHCWVSEVLISDQIEFNQEERVGQNIRLIKKRIWLPVRFFNFQFCVWKILCKKNKVNANAEDLKEAIFMAKSTCIDMDGDPVNLTDRLGVSYNKIIEMTEARAKGSKINPKIKVLMEKMTQTVASF